MVNENELVSFIFIKLYKFNDREVLKLLLELEVSTLTHVFFWWLTCAILEYTLHSEVSKSYAAGALSNLENTIS